MDRGEVKHDPFCWKCCKEDTNRQCSECERSYHGKCVAVTSDLVDGDNGWICPVCAKIKSASTVHEQKGLEMLAIIMKRVYDDPTNAAFRTLSNDGNQWMVRSADVIVKPMNLNILKEKIAMYQNFEEFLADAEWMLHNCTILYSESHERTHSAKILLDYFSVEIESVKKCADCYANATKHSDTWFTLACDEPHLLVWAKQKGFNYWPAKLMSIDGLMVNVRFFGDHTHADIPATNCSLYSKQNPSRLKHTSNLYTVALKEANKYIANIREKFGTYKLIADRHCIDPAKYELYMAQAFPDLAKRRQAATNESGLSEHLVEMEHIDLSLDSMDQSVVEPAQKRSRLTESMFVAKNGNATGVSNQVVRKENVAESSVKLLLERSFNECTDELMAIKEQHNRNKMNLEMTFKTKLEKMQRDYDEQVEKVKKKFFSRAGF